jgi:hypothetical protein
MSAPLSFQSLVVVVTHPAKWQSPANPAPTFGTPRFSASFTIGVGHEPQSLSDMRRTEARSRDTGRCEGVADSFHVSSNKVEPAVADRCFNLLTKDNVRAALADETEPFRPQMALVGGSCSFSGCTERLAGAGSSPNGSIIWPSCEPQCVAPDADAGEEVALSIPSEVVGFDILDAPFVNITGRNVTGRNQIPQPLRGVRVNLVVVGDHAFPSCIVPGSTRAGTACSRTAGRTAH